MPKHGRGLNKEISIAVKEGKIIEPFSVSDIRTFVSSKGWEIPETYISVCLANGSSETHSSTYKKYFIAVAGGKYRLSNVGVKED